MSEEMIPLSTISNENNYLQVAKYASRELSKAFLQDPNKADAEILPLENSPRKDLLKNTEWRRMSLLISFDAEQSGLLAIRTLSDAFFYKCGYRLPFTTPAENRAWERKKRERGAGTRSECVVSSTKRLKDEAHISLSELQNFLQLKAVVNPESIFQRDNQNEAAHSLPVAIMAFRLQRLFRARPDEKAAEVLEKIFVWLCQKGWEEAIVEEDMRVIKREGVIKEDPCGLERVTLKDSEFSAFYDAENDKEEEVGSFF